MAFGDPDDVDHLILGEDSRDWHSLLQMLLRPVHFVRDPSPVQLHLHDVGLFLTYGKQSHLEMEKHVKLHLKDAQNQVCISWFDALKNALFDCL